MTNCSSKQQQAAAATAAATAVCIATHRAAAAAAVLYTSYAYKYVYIPGTRYRERYSLLHLIPGTTLAAMSEEKPMTIKDRMAALARASSGGNSGTFYTSCVLNQRSVAEKDKACCVCSISAAFRRRINCLLRPCCADCCCCTYLKALRKE